MVILRCNEPQVILDLNIIITVLNSFHQLSAVKFMKYLPKQEMKRL